jgi:Leucine-rich repeat (LRR) protein
MTAQILDVFHFVAPFLTWPELLGIESVCRGIREATPESLTEMNLTQVHLDKLQVPLSEVFRRYYRLGLIQYEEVNFQINPELGFSSVIGTRHCKMLKKIRFLNCVNLTLQSEMMQVLSQMMGLTSIVYTGEHVNIETVLASIYKASLNSNAFPKLKKISFQGCKFCYPAGFYLQKITERISSIRNIVLNGLGMGKELEVFSQAIQQIPYIKKLNLGFNGLESEGARILTNILNQAPKTLEKLNIGSNWLGAGGISAISPVFILQPKIKILNLSRNRLGVQGARTLATCISNCRNLESLNLKDNQIREGIAELMPAIASLPNLQKLNLSFNLLRLEGGRSIGASLSLCKNLTTLILTSNDLQEGFSLIASEFPSTSLKTVIAKSNKIPDACLYTLIENLPHSSIQKLVLDMNAFTYSPLSNFIQLIHSTTSLDLRLKLPGNLSEQERTAFKEKRQLLGYR